MKGDVVRFERGKGKSRPPAASSIDDREDQFLVGRERERALFERFLAGEPVSKPVWNLYGTGGVGKSTLLDAFRRQARRRDAVYVQLDSREFRRTGDDFCRKLLLQLSFADGSGGGNEEPLAAALGGLNRLAQDRQVVVALDTIEEMTGMDDWLREQFLRRLDPRILVLLAGRHPLKGQWLLSPAWRERTLWLAIEQLTRTDVLDYARKCGLTEEAQGERLWERTRGHGLSLSLAVSTALLEGSGPLHDAGWSSELASSWLKEVPDEELRQLVEAASMLRQFNQELLAYVMEQDISAGNFGRLTSLSFVRKIEQGWRLHDLMRESTRSQLRERAPVKFGKLMERCVRYYASTIKGASGKRDVAPEVGELFCYIGDALIRAHLNATWKNEFSWESLSASNLGEGLQYLQQRRNEARTVTRRGIDPVTGSLLELTLSGEETLYTIEGVDLEELLGLGQQSVMLMKTQGGKVHGLSAIIPINRGTLAYLEQNPFSGPYIRSLSAAERKELDVSESEQAGWFIRSIDILDWTDSALLQEGGAQMYNYMCSGKLFFASPPPLPMFHDSHLGLGFEAVPDVFHCSYDGKTPTPTFVLDTRGEKLDAYLAAMLRRIGIQPEPAETRISERAEREDTLLEFGLTEREREVVQCVLEGCSNLEIAARLFISEITVKKHLSSVYAKMQVKNRSQLIKAVLQ
ncbi:helix-turn-helix transcriptional regulator [Paenibacillus mesophilus]|uniref:LuxR family transcriptional regulator n=1 Tax=Paenibacillus mesophilus TaxID=2582849 RepID=UPI00110F5C3F|nr:LuxR family transcriptional regulator [Paenibacillus mesophilus]TMV49122.1 helix-turn-helix transcriptional regulator [Paenibacillus mesophilus]